MTDTPGSNQPVNNEAGEEVAPLRYNLDSLEDYISVGEQVAHEGRLDEAVDVMREGTTRFPESPTGQYNLGVALYLRLRQDHEHLELWENLADDEQLAEEAIFALEGAIDADPNFVEAYNNLARLYALRGRKADAVNAWKKSLSLKADQPEVQADMDLYAKDFSPSDEEIETQTLLHGDEPEKPV